VKLGLNQVAARLNRVCPPIANAFLEAEYSAFTDFEESKSRSDAWTTLSSRLYPILTDDIVRSFDGSDFSAKDLLFSDKPTTVYFCWPEAELPSLTPLIRLVWESLVYDLIATYDLVDGVNCHDVLLSLDEAGRTGLTQLPEMAATVNGRGISISMSGQSFEQFKSLYGEYRAKSLLNNMDTQIYHRQASFDTARDLSGWLGVKSGWASSQSTHHGSEASEGKQEREIPLLTARQIAQLDDEEILILHRNIPPIRARRFSLSFFPALAKRVHIDPPPLPALPRAGALRSLPNLEPPAYRPRAVPARLCRGWLSNPAAAVPVIGVRCSFSVSGKQVCRSSQTPQKGPEGSFGAGIDNTHGVRPNRGLAGLSTRRYAGDRCRFAPSFVPCTRRTGRN
jgi:type IV secretory pathway TraG/TraD family ATPase VirD4